jgi:hypothetical protein
VPGAAPSALTRLIANARGSDHRVGLPPCVSKICDTSHRRRHPKARLQSSISRETWAGAQRSRPAGVRTPRASNSWATAANVVFPDRWISAITARVVALALVACSDLAARARAAVSTLPAVPSFRPLRLAAARAALVRHRRPKWLVRDCCGCWVSPSSYLCGRSVGLH